MSGWRGGGMTLAVSEDRTLGTDIQFRAPRKTCPQLRVIAQARCSPLQDLHVWRSPSPARPGAETVEPSMATEMNNRSGCDRRAAAASRVRRRSELSRRVKSREEPSACATTLISQATGCSSDNAHQREGCVGIRKRFDVVYSHRESHRRLGTPTRRVSSRRGSACHSPPSTTSGVGHGSRMRPSPNRPRPKPSDHPSACHAGTRYGRSRRCATSRSRCSPRRPTWRRRPLSSSSSPSYVSGRRRRAARLPKTTDTSG